MKYLITLLLLCLTGCSTTVPVTITFPDAPKVLMEKCPPLQTIEGEKISIIEITKSVTINYTTYYECSVKVDNWIEWYKDQKKIFDKVSK
jgi:uncharacterized protein YcfL